jgi:hypothetical protein
MITRLVSESGFGVRDSGFDGSEDLAMRDSR